MCASPVVCPHDPSLAAVVTGAGLVAPVVSCGGVWAGVLPASAASPEAASLGYTAASRLGRPALHPRRRAAPHGAWMPGMTARVSFLTPCLVSYPPRGAAPCPPLATGPGAPPTSGLDHGRPRCSSRLWRPRQGDR